MRKVSKEDSTSPSVEEVAESERLHFRLVQNESFTSNTPLISGLRVCKDEDGLIRVKTQVTNRDDTPDFKCPVLLPQNHPLVYLLILEEHVYKGHGGAQFVMGQLREKVWVVHGRLAVKKLIRQCVTCQRFASRKKQVPTPALPEARVKSVGAFDVTGIDLAGPLILKDKSKVWIVIFTCAVYRCVHLELVTSISTEDFLMAFTRFCFRKKRPSFVYTDNGTNFVGAVNVFKKINWKKFEESAKHQRIQWRFNPPSGPWWGGWWERLIRSLKDILKRMFGFAKLSYTDLETCVCEAEWVMNNRPLTFITEDQEDLVPLTPAMFITYSPNLEMELPEVKSLTGSLGAKKNGLAVMLEQLKDRFRKEYLGLLVQREGEKISRHLQVGDSIYVSLVKA